MTQAEIIAMATESGLNSYRIAPGEAVAVWGRFAALVAAKEREACVQLVEAVKHCEQDPLLGAPVIARAINECADDLADAIRARGQKEGA